MQIQTTTITIENTTSFGANFTITTFVQKVSAFCDTCPNQATGAKTFLKIKAGT